MKISPLHSAPLLVSLGLAAAQGQVPYSTASTWESYTGGVTTGGALADIDGDGFVDFVVANGNDILRQSVEVYTNDGAGGFPLNPQWSSSDVDYHGHLSVGDVDQDGDLDVAVAVFLGVGAFGDEGYAKLYDNQGGTLSSLPTWESSDTFYAFSCDLGDADSDGDLDLAVAVGEPYFDPPDRNRIYYNSGGTLATTPGWLSAFDDHTLDVAFGDADGDGDLDLAFATSLGPTRVFYQGPGGISTTPGFTATDNPNQNGNTLAWADVDADGFLELAVSDNSQLTGGAGTFKIYDNVGGSLATTPFWSDFVGFSSAVAFADLKRDGAPDLVGGIWFGGTHVYLNNAGSFPTTENWQSAKNSTVEVLVFADVDRNGLISVLGETHLPNGGRTYYLDHAPVHSLASVTVDGVVLSTTNYSLDLEDGWLALDRTPAVSVVVDYEYSESLDLGVTNWDQSIGNQVYLRRQVPVTSFRTDAGSANPLGYAADEMVIGRIWNASVDNSLVGNTMAAVIGFQTPLELPLACCGVLLVNIADPGGEVLALPLGAGTGVVPFNLEIPNSLSLLGFTLSTQGIGLGGGVSLHNAFDHTIGV